ncbi:hypothetical protein [Nonomuraea gerenzanensis]|uniref:Uncharacterized protein n=1 Tax=Nonomuraea gerenzanensis TaxID=93944 RepID=A0A1M4EGV1_9ACTN|nr:hypothetical protein [Nonomuraea gerenzanensis]SBO98050.1 hypothetical protein BN4615_P7566 [Nonomuraea gerenzanensis]
MRTTSETIRRAPRRGGTLLGLAGPAAPRAGGGDVAVPRTT